MNSEDKMEMLRWLSRRNAHMTPSDLAFLLDIPADELDGADARDTCAPMQSRPAVVGTASPA